MLYAPLNPADLNTIEGKYPKPLDLETPRSRFMHSSIVAGSEGIGRVRHPGGGPFQKGDLVFAAMPGMGTMRSFLWVPSSSLLLVPPRGEHLFTQPPQNSGAALSMLPQLGGTALRMLLDFIPEGAVIQNAGNSGVGFMASQLAHVMNREMISIVRRGTKSEREFEDLVEYLTKEGKSSVVVAEDDLTYKESIQAFHKQLQAKNLFPRLALNAVGGNSASLLSKLMEPGGAVVTYGGMSKEPVMASTGHLIFKNFRYLGYWHSRWMTEHTYDEKEEMIDTLIDYAFEQKISCPPFQVFSLANFQEALLVDSGQSGLRRKIVFKCQED
jgi:trans-2-enoyl-CoA reductase